MSSLAAALIAFIKAIPALERIFAQCVDLYAEQKRAANVAQQSAKDQRNAAAVDAARGVVRVVGVLCPTCPFAAKSGGQHGAATPPSAILNRGDSGA
jgi:hypothetical protein